MTIKGYTVAVVGATGAVGQQMVKYLEKREFPVKELRPLASKRSAGGTISFKGQEVTIQEATPEAFEGVEIALFSAGGNVSKVLAPEAVKRGAVVIDNSSAFRMDPQVPLIVPEVNADKIKEHQGIIANPNCSTIQMVVALKPLLERYGIERIIVSTYQAVSGAGWKAAIALEEQSKAVLNGEEVTPSVLPVGKLDKHYQIAFNVIPQIDVGQENGYTFEEMKMVNETKKILGDDSIGVTATCVRVPVVRGHSESVYVELKSEYDLEEVRQLLSEAPGVIVQDDIQEQVYPMPLQATDRMETFIGRLRRDLTHPRGLNMWVVSDNLLKGAATNAVQIAEALIDQDR
ncbi:aspartate-semialdehyde dehydrogenase [Laceyella sacchari]|jgi:aspartate-semialdehyde dehydrogenase|uniref:aspartate-semialdehyde dehydrogenase n=1 Tax=Laceyella sacchari TaxID=37482 RepID=UPI00104533C5|nr:aspartate-semialdehyde dehydrogenase [Laceyella sacchari]TCW35651.1 aspartate-semialdehyde dehydrogenase [Laceyella sacchari]